jgi:glycosyltransferase involved in cell wall biosynthesis
MKVSVILSTYNEPRWLEKVLWGFSAQTHRDFELIVADDGSTAETADMVARVRQETGLVIRHVWHEDRGFRKCEILNKAILHSRADYLVFTDGDCIPRSDFLAVHVAGARPGRFLTGSAIRLPDSTSEAITREDILSGRCFGWRWLRAHGLPLTNRTVKIMFPRAWAGLMNALPTARPRFTGGNASVYRADMLAVNGFDQRMAWGGLDREVGVRLENSGVRGVRVRYSAHVLHLAHPRSYADPAIAKANRELRQGIERSKIAKTDFGINRLIEQGYTPSDD